MNPTVNLSVQYASEVKHSLPDRSQLRRWVKAAAEKNCALTIRFVDREEGFALNSQYRGKDYATNVLTFVYDESKKQVSGDIVICAPVIADEAHAQKIKLADHYAHMVLHGCLHLQGYDHEQAREAVKMESREAALLQRFRIADPYQATHV
jgi:probable rRNA maturation factor